VTKRREGDGTGGGDVPTPVGPTTTPDVAPQPTDTGSGAAKIPSLSLSGVGTYKDEGGESHEKITYTVDVPSGQTHSDYCLVQWFKGSMKNGDGSFFRAKLYGSVKEINAADWQIDSTDADPIYWSTDKARWNYNSSGNKFTATDDPGPALSSEKGAVYALQFKVAVYKTADVPTTTTGTISTAALTSFEYWNYSVVVDKDGKFTHPRL
jgi:hypothetical protein